MRRYWLLSMLALWLAVGASCIDRPDYVLDEALMTDVLVDVHRAEGLIDLQQNNFDRQTQQQLMAAVLVKHGVSRAQYDSSLVWYAQHLKLLTRVYGHVSERLADEHEYWEARISDRRDFHVSEAGDSVNLWTQHPYVLLDAVRHTEFRYWTMQSDSNFVKGDTLVWRLHVTRPMPGACVIASMCVSPDVAAVTHVADCDTVLQLVAASEEDTRISSLALSLALIGDTTALPVPTMVDSITLFRYHRR